MHQPDLAVQLRIASQRVWRKIPLGMRLKIAVHRMLAEIYKGIGEAIVVILADHGFHVPRDARGKVDTKDRTVADLGSAIYKKVRGVLKQEADIEDVIHKTFLKVFLEQKSFLKLRGDSFSDYRSWILTAFHNAARDYAISKGRAQRRTVTPGDEATSLDDFSPRQKLEIVETHLRQSQKVPWERHPMWRQVKQDVMKALSEFDRKERSNRPKDKIHYFPVKRVFELMVLDGLTAPAAARVMRDEGLISADPSSARHALRDLRNRLNKVVKTVVDAIEDREMLDSFFDAITA